MDEALRRPGTVANRNLEQSMYLHRSCLPLVEVDLGEKDMSGGVAGASARGCAGRSDLSLRVVNPPSSRHLISDFLNSPF